MQVCLTTIQTSFSPDHQSTNAKEKTKLRLQYQPGRPSLQLGVESCTKILSDQPMRSTLIVASGTKHEVEWTVAILERFRSASFTIASSRMGVWDLADWQLFSTCYHSTF
jgi:hypothetical protein